MKDFIATKIPSCYRRDDGIVLVNRIWWQEGDLNKDFVEMKSKTNDEIECYLREAQTPSNDWILLNFENYSRSSKEVIPLPDLKYYPEESLAFPDHLRYVHNRINRDNWKKIYNYRSGQNMSPSSLEKRHPLSQDLVLFTILKRLYAPVVINHSNDIRYNNGSNDPFFSSAHRLIITNDEFILFQPYKRYNLYSVFNFSNSILTPLRTLFILYQIIRRIAVIHDQGLSTGDLRLKDIVMDSTFRIDIRSSIDANLIPSPQRTYVTSKSKELTKLSKPLNTALNEWMKGKISNFEYLMILNNLCGRNRHNPNYYPILPWVRDFTSPTGGWRDLTKSKFRLNKGDQQLDLTYNCLLNEAPLEEESFSSKKQIRAPHHVSDLLSEITYYVYRARVTSKTVLCKYVRSRWVPHEYPSSIQRLQEWTPDECIPEFYTAPGLFKSVHDDLEDLELPPWTSSPEEFIEWHMESLESSYVSERLHHWIDLTFGYKLTGSAAVRAKNVCLHLADEHTDLRDSGVIQLFNSPHPMRESVLHNSKSTYFSSNPPLMDIFLSFNNYNQGGEYSPDDPLKVDDLSCRKKIQLPNDYDPIAALTEIESNFAFSAKSYVRALDSDNSKALPAQVPAEESLSLLQHRRNVRDMQNLGVLILELFCYKKFSCLGQSPSLESRYSIAKYIIKNELNYIPLNIRNAVVTLLNHGKFNLNESDIYPTVNQSYGSPSPSAKQLLIPFISSELPFSPHFKIFTETSENISIIDEFIAQNQVQCVSNIDDIHQIKVKLVASNIIPLLDQLKKEELDIFLPTIQKLFKDSNTTILSSWYLFDPLGKALGPSESMKNFLEPLINIFESSSHTSKHLKLYHRTFLLSLVLRLGTKNFLEYFISYVIEAVGGYKDFRHNDFKKRLQENWKDIEEEGIGGSVPGGLDKEESVEGEMFAIDIIANRSCSDDGSERGDEEKYEVPIYSEEELRVPSNYNLDDVLKEYENDDGSEVLDDTKEGNISQVASESIVWLAHRLGPVLSARYLTRNLLKMLNLCFMGPECAERVSFNDRKSRISNFKTKGDSNAENVLDSLGAIADLYGEQMILLQYIPYAKDLIENCKTRLNSNMEGGVLGVMALIHYIIPFLSDSVIMSELQDTLLTCVLFPALQLLTSKLILFPGGIEVRRLLAFRILDVIYLIGLRIGEEMSRGHLTPLCTSFFSSFEKNSKSHSPANLKDIATEELDYVMTPEVAYTGYVGFYHLMGKVHLDSNVYNIEFIKSLCYSVQNYLMLKPINFTHLRIPSCVQLSEESDSPASLGNKLSTYVGEFDSRMNDFVRSMITRESPNTSRHLRGNWLAYWEHELGRPENKFTLKQIRLQGFNGHSAPVKSLHVLDNENSFLSGSRDKTVKVWSLRSQNDETSLVVPQWTYTLHKKSVFSVTYLENNSYVASCDSTIHIWDPFVGSSIHQFNGIQNVASVLNLPSPSTTLLAATLDSLIHLVDVRSKVTTDLKVCVGSSGLIKCMCIQSDGYTATIGHSSGYISNLDLRTGKIRHTRKGHDGEILVLAPLNSGSKFVSTSLDQSVNVWDKDVKLQGTLPGPQEPIHCICTSFQGDTEDIITGSTANRIGVRHGTSPDSPFISNKLKSDIIKGNLTSLKFLSMNRLLLLGTDTGSIQLIC
uniref:Putative LOC100169061 [Acyrthosiphon pisum] n=1 Tax=Lepeophtheirus salmonis TaxID=72036 RepID=A0A0K2UX53_LEPSM